MSRHLSDDWLDNAHRVISPNFDDRPEGETVSLIVVHGISLPPGEYEGNHIDAFFTNSLDPDAHPYFREICAMQVSSHLLIRRDGALVQYVPFAKRAWHAGVSCYQGCDACNDFSIGIELEGQDDQAYTDRQYQVLAETVSHLRQQFPAIEENALVGHSDIAPGRKTDPGPAFNWLQLSRLLAQSDA
ncbi:MAG: 1,6-anhydro-N-acetylmuramyl-L-alanine amidase AmpD [Gammaproteobacteria bacterium]